jgi:hypothetical protein
MVRFREHRGSLEESMDTLVVLRDRRDLIAHLRYILDPLPVSDKKVTVRYYCFDEQTGWNTYIVTVGGRPVGFTDGRL